MTQIDNEIRNPIFIKKIHLEDYLSYKDLEIDFSQNIQTLIGPNESGKTNLIIAFEKIIKPSELTNTSCCYYSENPVKTQPKLSFYLNMKEIKKIFPKIKENKFNFSISNKKIEPDTIKYDKREFEGCEIKLKGKLPTGQIHFTCPEFLKYIKLPGSHLEQNIEYSGIIESVEDLSKIRQYVDNHPQKNQIEFAVGDLCTWEEDEKTILTKTIFEEIKIVYWKFDESEFIPSFILYSDLIANPSKFQPIINMFTIAGYKIEDLKNPNYITRNNILGQINKKVSEILSESWTQYQNVELRLSFSTDRLELSFLENDRETDPQSRSMGFRWFFAFLLHFNAKFGNELKNCIILLDEPGLHLHPGGQRDLLSEIEELSQYNQIIYSTHLPFMINRNHPNRIIFLGKKNGITYKKEPRNKEIIDDLLLSDTLGFNFSSISNWGAINLFVEGITDKILIDKISTCYAIKNNINLLDLNYISIIPINGISNIESFIRVAEEIKIKYLILLDDDKKGKEKYSKFKNHPKEFPNTIDFTFKLDNSNEIEDLIPFNLANEAFQDLIQNQEPFNLGNKDFKLDKTKKISVQFKEFVKESNELKPKEKIILGSLKLDFMLRIKDKITQKNCTEFKELIEILEKIEKKSKNLIQNSFDN
jgi:predicted ATP-dependent endonuclease of OLD family